MAVFSYQALLTSADDKEKIAKAIIPKINIAPNNNFEEETPANVEKTAGMHQRNFYSRSIHSSRMILLRW